MSLPRELVIVRHGESEGNVAVKLSKRNDHSHFTDEFLRQSSRKWKLTNTGKEQAIQAGKWLMDNGLSEFDGYYVSAYERARQTASRLGLPNATWRKPKILIRERDRGLADVVSYDQLSRDFGYVLEGLEREPYLFRFPNGESLADVELRVREFLRTLQREVPKGKVIVVCHGEVMWVFRVLLEGLSLDEFEKLDRSRNPIDRIHNCQIIHYSRTAFDGTITPSFNRFRSICPTDIKLSNPWWRDIPKVRLSNQEVWKS